MTSPKRSADARERVEIKSRAEWRRWLAKHHAQTDAIWLVRWKKDRGPYVSYDDIGSSPPCPFHSVMAATLAKGRELWAGALRRCSKAGISRDPAAG